MGAARAQAGRDGNSGKRRRADRVRKVGREETEFPHMLSASSPVIQEVKAFEEKGPMMRIRHQCTRIRILILGIRDLSEFWVIFTRLKPIDEM